MNLSAEPTVRDLFDPPVPRAGTYPTGVPVDVCDKFEEVALIVHALGFDKYSARAIAHRIRWHEQIERGNREFKINNVWTPAMARWFMARHPDMKNFFETRGDE